MSKLQEIRLSKEMTQFRLSIMSRVHPSRISLFENGLTTPTIDEQQRLSKVLGTSVEEIFGDKNQHNKLRGNKRI